jgi:hypothetical protein
MRVRHTHHISEGLERAPFHNSNLTSVATLHNAGRVLRTTFQNFRTGDHVGQLAGLERARMWPSPIACVASAVAAC